MTGSLLAKRNSSISEQIQELTPLVKRLKESSFIEEKLKTLDAFLLVKNYFNSQPLKLNLSPEEELVVKAMAAVGQAERILKFVSLEQCRNLFDTLIPVEKFYAEVGGLVGYHWMMLRYLSAMSDAEDEGHVAYHRPEGIDISKPNREVRKAIIAGIANLRKMGEIYPLGGAADRLRLLDEKTGMPLPAARLLFCGKTLLEGMVADLQAREYLHYKIYGEQLTTPVAMMTSFEKNNMAQIQAICEEAHWFGRPKEAFKFFCQPSVPTINKEGEWCLQGPMQLLLRPGGHGVIWKLARDEGIFDWFFAQGREKALVRQINNPIAGVDYGLVAFSGLGCAQDKSFGFASCPRQVKATEGINVLIEKKNEYVLTNIEYCDFKKYNIVDEPVEPGSPYSKFPSNTNILFVDLRAILQAIAARPIPGMLVNLKKATYRTDLGVTKEEEIARLESMMQNIADFFTHEKKEQIKAFLTFNERRKTISVTKREFVLGSSLLETPEGCFLDLLNNVREMLVDACGMEVPEVNDPATFFAKGPSFLCLYHPALGPLYSIIAQKIRGGWLHFGSELQLEIAELDMEEVDLMGSLFIRAEALLGGTDKDGIVKYSEMNGKCTLKNVRVRNFGIDRDASNIFWRNEIHRKESCSIILQGNGEFIAEDITLAGDIRIEVKDGTRVMAVMEHGKLTFREEKISAPTWSWKHNVKEDFSVELTK